MQTLILKKKSGGFIKPIDPVLLKMAKILFHQLQKNLSRITARATTNANTSLESKLFSVMSDLVSTQGGEMFQTKFQQLTEDVVYLVLNATQLDSPERAFVAGLNRANIHPTALGNRFIENCHENLSDLHGNALLFSTDLEIVSPAVNRQIQKTWNCIWSEYLRLSTENEQGKNIRLTINQFLLYFAEFPQNIGFYWGENQPEASECYHFLDADTLRAIGVGELESFSEKTFFALPKNTPDIPHETTPILEGIMANFREMEFNKPEADTLENALFCLYHLLRCYGCWGGSAFVSIPVSLGKKVGILSICSRKPFDNQRLELWNLVAYKLFSDIMLVQVEEFAQLQETARMVESIYGIGHMLKNRSSLVQNELNSLAKTTLPKISNPTDRALLHERFRSSIADQERLTNIGHMLDILSRSGEGQRVFLIKPEWHREESLNLNVKIKETAQAITRDNRRAQLTFTEDLNLQLRCFIPGDNGTYVRPSDFLYEDVFAEVFINGLKYGHSQDENTVEFRLWMEKSTNRLCIANTFSQAGVGKVSEYFGTHKLLPNMWAGVKTISSGGIFYLDYLLEKTRCGKLEIRFVPLPDNQFEFQIGFQLVGL